MNLKRIILGLAVASVAVAVPAPAQAAGSLLLQENQNGSGVQSSYTQSNANLGWTSNPILFSDRASRAVNNSGYAWVLYDDQNYQDRHYCIKPNQAVNLHNSAYNFGDKISSVKKLNTTSCAGYPTF